MGYTIQNKVKQTEVNNQHSYVTAFSNGFTMLN